MSNRVASSTAPSVGRPVDALKYATILAAARHEFFNVGFAQASIESIAARAGVSKVTVYNRFKTKEALFARVVEGECDVMRSALTLEAHPGQKLRERLIHFGTVMTTFLAREDTVNFERHLAVEVAHNPEIGLLFLNAGPRRLHQALATLLDQAVAEGDLHIEDTRLAAEHLAGMIKGLADIERRFGAIPQIKTSQHAQEAEQRVSSAVDVFLRAYRKG
jgi:TetR/AcrR family transcriptional regulator, mexJK operon transcriptional repressor